MGNQLLSLRYFAGPPDSGRILYGLRIERQFTPGGKMISFIASISESV